MKKKGFSLAELMIAMGVVGVVAAITIPMLIENAQKAQIGPKLAKAVSAFEQATAATLHEYEVERISDIGYSDNVFGQFLSKELSNHLKLVLNNTTGVLHTGKGNACILESSKYSTADFQSPDGVIYTVTHIFTPSITEKPHNALKGFLKINLNGHNKPNRYGTDIFMFAMYDDGSLRPMGSSNWIEGEARCSWKDYCPKDAEPTDAVACAGHIFENNLKVLYKQ